MALVPHSPRRARRTDIDAIEALLLRSFPGPQEAGLAQDLRAASPDLVEWVITVGAEVAAYAAISAMQAPEGWRCLAPVAVKPEWQGRGLGLRVVRWAVGRVLEQGQTLVVLGAPAFYARAGFSTARAARLTSPYPIEHTLIARPGMDVPEAALVYAAAFDGV